MSERTLLTVKDVARRIQVSDWTVREWLRTGRLRGIRPGGTKIGWRIAEADVARFLAAAPNGRAADVDEDESGIPERPATDGA